jgi:hypothetical protein
MAARPDVVALLTGFDAVRTGSGQRFVHRNGQPSTAAETALTGSATGEDMRAAASELAAKPERPAGFSCSTSARPPRGTGDGEPPAKAP